jgi:hypothetical protein
LKGYDMTEVNIPLYMPYDAGLRPHSCGKALKRWLKRKIVDPDTDEKLPPHTISEMVVRPTFRGAALCRARHRTSQDAAGQDSEAQAPEGRPYCQHLGSRGRKILHQMSLRLLQELSPFKGQVQGKIG